ncbi:MAG: TolC family protein [Bacteroidales bacterium]|nr:TolC family protein [Bacteroidales bacterium]MDI9573260.1 TolC family protein [Bacteroidota bacterium]OQC59301.1 MAG: Outer membrane efflux protein [Bacteroidetes bacterium ADurb.Bin012]MBP9511298.1 TolC family protein [Bacteroidales bacterium]MBP9588153.1 TolC family protein [Bacteroidales bacterium]
MKFQIFKITASAKKSRLFFLIFCVTAFASVHAQEVYNLQRCIATALEQNYNIKIVCNEEKIASNNFTRGNAGFLPTIKATTGHEGSSLTTHQTFREGNESNSKTLFTPSADAGINLNMTLFQGYRAQTTYHKLDELKQLGELDTQMAIENLISQIISEYYYYIQQLNLYKNLEYAVQLSRERVRIDEERYILGSSSKVDLLQSIVYLNSDSSRFSKQNEVLRTSQIRLKKLMGENQIEGEFLVIDTSIPINANLDYDELLDNTLSHNTALQIASKNKTITGLDYQIISSCSYPYLNLKAGYNYSYNGYETGSLKNQQVYGFNYGLTLGMNVFDGSNQKREKANARLEVENKEHNYDDILLQIKADLVTIYYAYQNNLKLLQLEQQNLAVARENLEIAMERYKLGNLSGLELREVQKSLLDAEERLISVKYQTKLAEISLFQISGKLLEYL